ncbi:MAG: DNA repair protein RecO C-terminal domain-containing protein [Planctomycetota bacterium]
MSARGAVQDRGLLLRRVPFGNTSLVVHVLFRDRGRRELMAKGAYRPKSRLSGVLDWFDELELSWTEPAAPSSRRRGTVQREALGQVRTGALEVRRRGPTRSLSAYRAASAMTELMEVATRHGAAERAHFELLSAGYDALPPDDGPGAQTASHAALAAFELSLAAELGLFPALEECAVCGEPAPPVRGGAAPRAAFSATLGGRLCREHAEEARARAVRVGTLPVETLEAAARLGAASPAGALEALGPDAERLAPRVLDLTGRFLDRQLETRPKSRARFLAAPDRNRAPR